MHDNSDAVIYVGKAVKLCNRVKQYFMSARGKTTKILRMVGNIAWFEYIVTDSEREALVLENNLIKEYHPKYNTMLTDDKGYPYISVSVQEKFPRVYVTRHVEKDKARYFGPYTSAYSVGQTLKLLQEMTKTRTCRRNLDKDCRERPCIQRDMGRCMAPCTGLVTPEEYRKQIDFVIRFLEGDYKSVTNDLKTKMKAASDELNFEEALHYRDLIQAVEQLSSRQKITDLESSESRDYIAYAREGGDAMVSVFFVRDGKVLGRDNYHLSIPEGETEEELLSSFVKQFYSGTPNLPDEVVLPVTLSEEKLISEVLTEKRGRKVALFVPKRGEKEHFLTMAEKNASIVLDREKGSFSAMEKEAEKAVSELERITGLSGLHRMEAFDISNISGYESVGSMVVFVNGVSRKNDYRRYRIKTVSGPNDYASMAEVLSRRFSEKHLKTDALPDVILMDGGKGQVHIAEEVLKNAGISIPVLGMVKDDRHRTRGLYFRDVELPIATDNEAFKLITRIQDEAHRFAITYHRGLHTKNSVKSVLSEIPGVGPKRELELIRRFRDIDALREATPEEIGSVPGFNRRVAEEVYEYLHKDAEKPGAVSEKTESSAGNEGKNE